MAEASPAKRARTEGGANGGAFAETCSQRRAAALKAHGREEMVDSVFHAWDRDGSGRLDFEEVLPHYMKSSRHSDLMEAEVRKAFEHFMSSQGSNPSEGITPELFRKWLGKLNDDQIAAHYVRHVEGLTPEPYRMNVGHAVLKEYQNKSLKEILDSPVHALCGLSDLRDDTLAPLGLHTVRDVGNWRCFLLARAVCTLAGKELAETEVSGSHRMNIRNALLEKHASVPLKHVLDLPVSALSMFPPKGDAALHSIRISTIGQLGRRQYFHWANAMVELEKFENEGHV